MKLSCGQSIEVDVVPVAAVRPKVTRWNTYYPGQYGKYLPKLREMFQQGWVFPKKDGPCSLVVEFRMPRPKSHFGSGRNSEVLKASAPALPHQDVDNLLKGVMDAASGVIYVDDKLVAGVLATKRYGDAGITVSVFDYGM